MSWVKRILSLKRAGHSGTLDPQVTGVLPVMLGNATKIANFLLTAGKEYICVMRLHKTYPEEKIRAVCNEFIGPIYQRPPLRSSVKRRVRTRRIYYLDILEIHEQNVLFKLGCQAGTYVRKFCFDIGEVLGAGAHMAELRRTRTGPFKEDETLVTLQDLLDVHHFWQEDKNEDLLRRYILPVEQGVSHLPQIIIRDSAIDAVCHGANLAVAGVLQLHSDIKTGDVVALMSQKGELVAVATALYSADHIMDAKSGIITDTKRVVMQEGTYPASWRRKTPKK